MTFRNESSPRAGRGSLTGLAGGLIMGVLSRIWVMRSRAPDALAPSPQTSPSSRAEDAASMVSSSNCRKTPPVMTWLTKTATAHS